MKNALICFLKFPQPGGVKTRLAEDFGDENAASLYEALAERVITEVFPLHERYDLILCVDPGHDLEAYQDWIGEQWSFWFQPEEEDLGGRMNAAVQRALDEGYGRVILIGSDCVGLSETLIGETFDKLDDHDFLIGPSTDGGYYLLALKADDPWLFLNMPWSTPDVLPFTIDRIEARDLKFQLLDEKIDIDTIEDLARFREQLPEEHFLSKKIDHLVLERLKAPHGLQDLSDPP